MRELEGGGLFEQPHVNTVLFYDTDLRSFTIHSQPVCSPKQWGVPLNKHLLLVVHFRTHSVFATFGGLVVFKGQDLARTDFSRKWEGRKKKAGMSWSKIDKHFF